MCESEKYRNIEPHYHTEEDRQAPDLQFQKSQTALPSMALENQFQWRI